MPKKPIKRGWCRCDSKMAIHVAFRKSTEKNLVVKDLSEPIRGKIISFVLTIPRLIGLQNPCCPKFSKAQVKALNIAK